MLLGAVCAAVDGSILTYLTRQSAKRLEEHCKGNLKKGAIILEYIFGTNDYSGVEVLKTVGKEHTDLIGFQETVREYPDCTITDSFYVVQKTKSDKDAEGNCYDWYVINQHNRTVDKTKPVQMNLDVLMASMLEG